MASTPTSHSTPTEQRRTLSRRPAFLQACAPSRHTAASPPARSRPLSLLRRRRGILFRRRSTRRRSPSRRRSWTLARVTFRSCVRRSPPQSRRSSRSQQRAELQPPLFTPLASDESHRSFSGRAKHGAQVPRARPMAARPLRPSSRVAVGAPHRAGGACSAILHSRLTTDCTSPYHAPRVAATVLAFGVLCAMAAGGLVSLLLLLLWSGAISVSRCCRRRRRWP